MEQKTSPSPDRSQLRRLERALKTLAESVDMARESGPARGAARMLTKSYTALHRKVSELLPNDSFVTDGMALEVDEEAPEKERLAQVRLMTHQLGAYLREHLPENALPLDFDDLRDRAPEFAARLEAKARHFEERAREHAFRHKEREEARAQKFEARLEAHARKIESHARKLEERLRGFHGKRKRGWMHFGHTPNRDDFEQPFQ